MKYLVSPIQLGQLIQEDNKLKREKLVEDILSLYYIIDTTDSLNLDDHIEINLPRRKERDKRRKGGRRK